MHIKQLTVKNFRGYKELSLPLDRQFNLIVGDNGSGKTAVLEALTVAIGAFFLGIRDADSRNIRAKDVRVATYENNEEQVFPVEVLVAGEINQQAITWARGLNSLKSGTTYRKSQNIKAISSKMDNAVRAGESVNLPLIVYYSTGRLWKNIYQKSKKNKAEKNLASRFRAYHRCLDAASTFRQFLKWFKGKELAVIQKRENDTAFDVVKSLIINCLPNCKNIYFEFDPDKPEGLKVVLEDSSILPFNYLSDGMRNLLALVADMAYKCVTLNPSLEKNAIKETEGIVLIDELDLHLHPSWQKQFVNILKNNFPKIQFITTSHSPFLIQETGDNQLIKLKNNQVVYVAGANDQSIEEIAEDVQDVANPQWSTKREKMYETAKGYFKALEVGEVSPELEEQLNESIKPYSDNPGYHAFLEQQKLLKKYKKNNTKP